MAAPDTDVLKRFIDEVTRDVPWKGEGELKLPDDEKLRRKGIELLRNLKEDSIEPEYLARRVVAMADFLKCCGGVVTRGMLKRSIEVAWLVTERFLAPRAPGTPEERAPVWYGSWDDFAKIDQAIDAAETKGWLARSGVIEITFPDDPQSPGSVPEACLVVTSEGRRLMKEAEAPAGAPAPDLVAKGEAPAPAESPIENAKAVLTWDDDGSAVYQGRKLALSDANLQFLHILAHARKNKKEAVSKEYMEKYLRYGTPVRVIASRTREKLRENGISDWIKSNRRKGYFLNLPPCCIEEPPPPTLQKSARFQQQEDMDRYGH